MNMQSEKHNALFTALRQCRTVPNCQKTSGYMELLFISIDRMPFLVPTLDNADPLFALVLKHHVVQIKTPGFYLHHMADQGGGSRPS